jgi:hypothetical protein
MNPADTLHRAAAKLRETAKAATPGPWEESTSDHGDVEVWKTGDYQQPVASTGYGPGIDEGAYRDAVYIAIVHPGVGLLLADLLDRAADYADHRIEEMAIARAILGDTSQPDTGRPA